MRRLRWLLRPTSLPSGTANPESRYQPSYIENQNMRAKHTAATWLMISRLR
ncbi:hypothetical protein FHS01_002577 [Longimicrobium terrae]|uniref:Uncharacterized protein n=1 Tax=Longimicrobium terrae TaxID=1639882 RepID=A0A841GYX4_9BACT|nr:hypothetical protein [Longimicrobium terrae]MBB6070918.1 hypothetical protein [Longimicrobium terrae]